MSTTLSQIYTDSPHEIVSSMNDLEITNPRDFDLSSTLQFVGEAHAAQFDFSAYVLIHEDGSNIEEERQRVAEEIQGFNNLLDAVVNAHSEFLANASRALDLIASFQQA